VDTELDSQLVGDSILATPGLVAADAANQLAAGPDENETGEDQGTEDVEHGRRPWLGREQNSMISRRTVSSRGTGGTHVSHHRTRLALLARQRPHGPGDVTSPAKNPRGFRCG
jgi:hypothetical protein